MFKILICDDEPYFLENTNKLVSRYLENNSISASVKTYLDGSFVLDDAQNGRNYDIYILDIEMPEYNGTELVRKLRNYSPESIIIFVTSYLQYAIESFELGIFRYIPKMAISDRLPLALRAAFNLLDLQDGKYFLIENAKRSQKVFYKNILYLYKKEKNTVFVLLDGEIKIREPLFEVINKLDKNDFIQIDRCFIVNIPYVHKIDSIKGELVLKNNIILNVSKSKMQSVKIILSDYWRNTI